MTPIGEDLYTTRFKPKTFDDYYLPEPIHYTFNSIMKMESIKLLVIGGTAVGKTSVLNTIVSSYYSETDDTTLNLLYINNLNDYGINYYKTQVQDFCKSRSTIPGKKKMIVIDNIDFIPEQSQQLFCISIDKYAHNIHFVASCANSHKVNEGFQSRLISVKLPQIKRDVLGKLANNVIKSDNLDISPEALDFIVNISDNNIKTMLGYLEKIKIMNCPIDHNMAIELCTDIHSFIFDTYIGHCRENNIQTAIHNMNDICDNGYSVIDILNNFFLYVKHTESLSEEEKYNIIPLICKFIMIFNTIHEEEIELAIFTHYIVQILT
jgi:DNA polymerase III gamma/tau subunit